MIRLSKKWSVSNHQATLPSSRWTSENRKVQTNGWIGKVCQLGDSFYEFNQILPPVPPDPS